MSVTNYHDPQETEWTKTANSIGNISLHPLGELSISNYYMAGSKE